MEKLEIRWMPVKGYEGLYEVSSDGRLRSLNYRGVKGRVGEISSYPDSDGYLQVRLWKDQKPRYRKVHRLVAEAFIPNPHEFPQINHKDEGKANNSIDNLEWCTARYNVNYGTRNERSKESISKANLNGKLSKAVIAVNPHTLETTYCFPSAREAGRNGFDPSSISHCCNGKLKTHKGLYWRYI
jgi:hypothetical protein